MTIHAINLDLSQCISAKILDYPGVYIVNYQIDFEIFFTKDEKLLHQYEKILITSLTI